MKRVALLVLAGCPASYGFNGHVVTTSEPLSVVTLESAGTLLSPELAPVANARVECAGCADAITVDANGRFRVGQAPSGPLTLRITADGYEAVELQLARSPMVSQAGLAEFVIVLRRE
jgi:hypothetical protein